MPPELIRDHLPREFSLVADVGLDAKRGLLVEAGARRWVLVRRDKGAVVKCVGDDLLGPLAKREAAVVPNAVLGV